jgi:hypothetical protein
MKMRSVLASLPGPLRETAEAAGECGSQGHQALLVPLPSDLEKRVPAVALNDVACSEPEQLERRRRVERETRLELATTCLGSRDSTN